MSGASRLIRVAAAALAAFAIGFTLLWVTGGTQVRNATAERSPAESPATPEPSAPPTAEPTPAPTPTPLPTPTPPPTPVTFEQAVSVEALAGILATPLPGCTLMRDDTRIAGTVTLACIEDLPTVPVVAAAAGRVLHVVHAPAAAVGAEGALPTGAGSTPVGSGEGDSGPALMVEIPADPVDLGPPDTPGQWSWSSQRLLGPHVVIDHGSIGGTRNTQTLYGGLASIDPAIEVGATIEAGAPIGTIAGPAPSLLFSVWSNDVRQDGAVAVNDAPPVAEQRLAAQALGEVIGSPTDPRCPLQLGASQLPGAPRGYRNGFHRGIDFGCGDALRSARAIADGTVVYLVDDYVDPSVAEREAMLANAGIAGFTPQWTLVMLYGNVVVIDHGVIPDVGRVITIAAHLEDVDPLVTLGSHVTQGQVIGEIGNRGTNASAQGVRGAGDPSLHLHWELFIDNWYLGEGLSSAEIREVVTLALCGAAHTPGCPAP